MPPARPNRIPVPLLAALAVTGIAVTFAISSLAGGGNEAPIGYQPFLMGTEDQNRERIGEGPVCISDPIGGDRSFCLDVEDGGLVALHVIPPGRSLSCPAQWDRQERRYADCDGEEVEPTGLRRFPVLLRPDDDDMLVFVDLRTLLPAPVPSTPAPSTTGNP